MTRQFILGASFYLKRDDNTLIELDASKISIVFDSDNRIVGYLYDGNAYPPGGDLEMKIHPRRDTETR